MTLLAPSFSREMTNDDKRRALFLCVPLQNVSISLLSRVRRVPLLFCLAFCHMYHMYLVEPRPSFPTASAGLGAAARVSSMWPTTQLSP